MISDPGFINFGVIIFYSYFILFKNYFFILFTFLTLDMEIEWM